MKRRFFSSLDMAILKKDIAIKNSQIKRGKIKGSNETDIIPCGCGSVGCFIQFNKK